MTSNFHVELGCHNLHFLSVHFRWKGGVISTTCLLSTEDWNTYGHRVDSPVFSIYSVGKKAVSLRQFSPNNRYIVNCEKDLFTVTAPIITLTSSNLGPIITYPPYTYNLHFTISSTYIHMTGYKTNRKRLSIKPVSLLLKNHQRMRYGEK